MPLNYTLDGSGYTVQPLTASSGVPAGGTTGQVLAKNSNTDGDVEWANAGAGDALTANPLSQFAATTSAQLRGVISDETGTGALYFASGALGTPTSGTLTNCTGLPLTSGVTGVLPAANFATGTPTGSKFLRDDQVWTTIPGGGDALVANPLSQFAATTSAQLAGVISDETGSGALVFATSPTLVTPALGTPSAAVLTNATGLPISTGVSGLGANVATFLATPSSANLAAAITNETGSGALVFATSPTLVTPDLGTPSAAVLTNATGLPVAGGGTGRATSTTAYGLIAAGTTATGAHQTLAAGATTEILVGGGASALPAWTTATGSGAPVRATSPTLTTPNLGTPSAATLTNATGLPISTGVSGLGSGVATFLATPSSANLRAAITDESGTGSLMFTIAPTTITSNATLDASNHFNRHITSAESADRTHAVSGTATNGDSLYVVNKGTAKLAFTGVTFAAGMRVDEILPGETFQAVYDGTQWVSLTVINPGISAINSQSSAYTLVSSDLGKTIYHPSADTTARIWTIPANSSVAFPIGTVVTFDNDDGAGAITIAITTDTLVLVGTAGTTGSRTLAEGGRATAQKVAATRWRISGVDLT